MSSEILISSEPLSKKNHQVACSGCVFDNWTLIPKDHMIICVGNPEDIGQVKSVTMRPIMLFEAGCVSYEAVLESDIAMSPA